MVKKIFVTGGTGFLGSYILLELLQRGEPVRALRRNDSSLTRIELIFRAYSDEADTLMKRIEWVSGDIRDVWSLADAMKDISHVIHAGGLVSWNHHDRDRMFEVNVRGTANVVNAALAAGVEKMVHISSVASFGGGGDNVVIDEQSAWKNSRLNTIYGRSKLSGEREAWRGMEEGLRLVVLNPGIILGYDFPDSGSAKLFKAVWEGLAYHPPGTNAFVAAKDVAQACWLFITNDISGERYILSEGNYPHGRILELTARALGKPVPGKLAGNLLLGLAWRLEWLRSKITGTRARLYHDTAMTSANQFLYSGEKIRKVPGFQYTGMKETIEETARLLIPLLTHP